MIFCPESPVWLDWKGQSEAAWRSKGQLQGQSPPALPQVTNLGATHFGDVEKQETTTFDEEAEGPNVPLRGSRAEEVFSSSEAGSSQLVRPPWPALTAVHPFYTQHDTHSMHSTNESPSVMPSKLTFSCTPPPNWYLLLHARPLIGWS